MTFQISFLCGAPGSFFSPFKMVLSRERSNRESPEGSIANLAHTHFFCNEQSSTLCSGLGKPERETRLFPNQFPFTSGVVVSDRNAPLVARKPPLCDRARTKTNTRPPLVPGDPQDVRVKAINSTSVRVDWKPPLDKERNGLIRGYHVHVQEIKDEVRIKLVPIRAGQLRRLTIFFMSL
jgi:Fibronectin type III domain